MVDIQTAITLSIPGEVPATALERAKDYARQARSEATKRVYRVHWSRFETWCRSSRLRTLPAKPATVAAYAAALAETQKPGSIQAALSAISQAHKFAGHTSPTFSPEVRATMAGIRRAKGTRQEGKKPLLTEDLRRLIDALPESLKGTRDRALLLLGFAGAFRRSELVALDAEDLDFTEEGLVIMLRRSKTDQEGEGRKIGIPYGSYPATCPVRSLRAWLAASETASGPVFRGINRHGQLQPSRLTGQSVALIVKAYAEAAGLDSATLAGHSLRAGFATAAARNGASERSIMEQTGHRSLTMVRKYIRDGSLFRDNAAAKLGL